MFGIFKRKQKVPFFGKVFGIFSALVCFCFFLSVFYGVIGRIDLVLALTLAPIYLLSDWMLPLALFLPLYATVPLFLSLVLTTYSSFYGGALGFVMIRFVLFVDIFVAIYIFFSYAADFPTLASFSQLLSLGDIIFFSSISLVRVTCALIIMNDPYYSWD